MCGIAGFTRFHCDLGDETTLERMGEAIRHRGPDAQGSYLQGPIALHHRRLSIIDLSAAGNQPMHSHCSRYTIVFNGEIYNFLELREALANTGYPFRTHTDTEVILALYARKGRDCLADLNGMFAFALWDQEAETLFLARDRIGKKPLYYSSINGDIAFASELKALLAAGLVQREIRIDALRDYFSYQYIPDPKTIFEGVFKLEPGHWLEITAGGQRKAQYWDLSFLANATEEDQATKLLGKHIQKATRRRMVADVPLGAFLSGGVDSSGIVATMSQLSEHPVTTCSIGFDEKRFNETEFARIVAEKYATNHHEYVVKERVAENLLEIARYFDEPFADPSLVPTYFVSKLARQQVTVALAGDGGDEVFAGYEKYAIDAIENRWRERVPAFIRHNLLHPIATLLHRSPFGLLRRAGTLLSALATEAAMGFYLSNAQITDAQWQRIASEDTQERLSDYHPSAIVLDTYRRCDGTDHLSRILYTDIKTFLPGDILVKVDRMSMAHALEVRAPLLDYELVEFAAHLPSALKFRDGEKKRILKAVFKPSLPNAILDRRKMGFSPPLADWFRDELRNLAEEKLLKAKDGLPGYFKVERIRELWTQHQARTHDHGAVLWSLLMFQLWWQEYMSDA
ncbi:Asparagine synthetase [glutamine-hydrolyzing] 1 [Thiorhodovibrio winogradskyi]|uniref:asparagine synthase (glutamine-hydrolyzing) n=1 Tax=Thiorhodovibrio winogradskyi TaxID=77007 RepID=A0ABZ0SAR4_9GAMM|nr:asparagine synthase (glutamine-hydrolyzing) [Thiorhodovibrio winogradskyi]